MLSEGGEILRGRSPCQTSGWEGPWLEGWVGFGWMWFVVVVVGGGGIETAG